MRLRTIAWLGVLLSLFAAPAVAQVHARCQGAPPSGTAPLTVIETTVSLAFEYTDADWTGITQANLLVNRVGVPAPVSTQVVMKSTITRLGAGNTADSGCYALPVVPVDQIPRGVPIQFTLTVTGADPLLASGPSNPTDPLGLRLRSGVLRAMVP